MRATILLRLALAGLGFALGLGVALAVRWRPPPDLTLPTCPDCRTPNGMPIQYTPLPGDPTKVVGAGQYGSATGTYPADTTAPYPRPVNGPRWYCPKCQAHWGPPAYHQKGRRIPRY